MRLMTLHTSSRKHYAVISAVSLSLLVARTGITATTRAFAAPVHIKIWTWYPNFKEVAAKFNATQTNVHVDWTNAGAGTGEYTKLKACIKARKGCPDAAMIEFQTLPTFAIHNPFVDMSKYGATNAGGRYASWAWAQSTSGTKTNTIPVDGGPMGMLYRKDLFAANKNKVSRTWVEYVATAIWRNNPPQFTATEGNDPGWTTGLMWQGEMNAGSMK